MVRTFLHFMLALGIAIGLTSCHMLQANESSKPRELASATENGVKVVLRLMPTENKDFLLAATFIPLGSGLHLYSKDIPKNGVNGLGRPTLLELTADSKLKARGTLIESVSPQTPDFEPKDLLVYPSGEVTLSLPVALPPGACWVNEKVSVTYMTCSDTGCKPPVVGKIIDINVPCQETATKP